MKTFKFLFATFILACFIGIAQTNAQTKAFIMKGSLNEMFGAVGDVYYEIDGEWYCAFSDLYFKFEVTPSDVFNWTSKGYIYLAFRWEGEGEPATAGGSIFSNPGWVQLDYIPLPKSAYTYYDGQKITITPTGLVVVKAHAN